MIDRMTLHIGMHKTGSSSIQQSLMQFDTDTHHYIELGAPNHSMLVAIAFGDDDLRARRRNRGIPNKIIHEDPKILRQRLTEELEACETPHLVLSAESLSGPENPPDLHKNMKQFFDKFARQIDVIGYVREPISLSQSVFQQRAKAGRTDDIVPKPVNYRERLEPIDTAYGRENVSLIKFARDQLLDQNIVFDFARRIGLDLPQDASVTTNETLTLEAVAVMMARNKFSLLNEKHDSSAGENQRLAGLLRGFGSRKLRFGRAICDPYLAAMSADLDWIEERIGQPMRDAPSAGDDSGDDVVNSIDDLMQVARDSAEALEAHLQSLLSATPDPLERTVASMDMLRTLAVKQRMKPRKGGAGRRRPRGKRDK